MTAFLEGQRVVVSLRDANDYRRLMQGLTGTIEEVKKVYVKWPAPVPGYLMRLDNVPPGHPGAAFWFEAHDLREEGAS